MELNDVLLELYGRIDEHVHAAVDDLDPSALVAAPAPGSNPIGWLIWHLTRVEDHHMSEILGEQQLWVSGTWSADFAVEPDPDNTGYGHSAAEVRTIRPTSAAALVGYYEAVARRTAAFLGTVTPADLDKIVDRRWDPPVTLGVRLISIADDAIQHAGQAGYVRGLLERD